MMLVGVGVDGFNWAVRKEMRGPPRLTASHSFKRKHLWTCPTLFFITTPPPTDPSYMFKQERKSAAHRSAKRGRAVDRQHPSSVQWRWVLLLWLPLQLDCNLRANEGRLGYHECLLSFSFFLLLLCHCCGQNCCQPIFSCTFYEFRWLSAGQKNPERVQIREPGSMYCFYGCPIMKIAHAKITTDRFLLVYHSFCWQFPSFEETSWVHQCLENYFTGRFTKLCPFPKSENKYRQNKGNQRDLPTLVKLGNHTVGFRSFYIWCNFWIIILRPF